MSAGGAIVEKIVAITSALTSAGVPHAFGGALALAWCTEHARGTIDLDLNLFLPPTRAGVALGALPDGVRATSAARAAIARDGQARLWWDTTPVDVFFNTTPFHDGLAARARREPLGGCQVPFLACRDLAVFKAFFDRTKDWADLEAMADAGALDGEAVLGVLATHLGAGDPRVARLQRVALRPRTGGHDGTGA